jgi:hypothetical protein
MALARRRLLLQLLLPLRRGRRRGRDAGERARGGVREGVAGDGAALHEGAVQQAQPAQGGLLEVTQGKRSSS